MDCILEDTVSQSKSGKRSSASGAAGGGNNRRRSGRSLILIFGYHLLTIFYQAEGRGARGSVSQQGGSRGNSRRSSIDASAAGIGSLPMAASGVAAGAGTQAAGSFNYWMRVNVNPPVSL